MIVHRIAHIINIMIYLIIFLFRFTQFRGESTHNISFYKSTTEENEGAIHKFIRATWVYVIANDEQNRIVELNVILLDFA